MTLASEDYLKARMLCSPHFYVKYPKELKLKDEHQENHATFLNLDITIKDGTFICKLFDKRDSFLFSVVRMPHIASNIPQNIFQLAVKGEFLKIARSTLCLRDFIPKAKDLLERMKQQGFKRGTKGTFFFVTYFFVCLFICLLLCFWIGLFL